MREFLKCVNFFYQELLLTVTVHCCYVTVPTHYTPKLINRYLHFSIFVKFLFSTLPAIHSSLLWSHTGRLYAALKMSPDEKSAERNTSHQSRLDVNWMAASVSALPAKRFLVWQVSTQSQRALALCPWMWASKWVTVCNRKMTCALYTAIADINWLPINA